MRDKRAKRQKGLTLIELLAVMAIIGILAAIIIPAVSGTGESGREAQGQQDSSSTDSAASDFFAAQSGAEILSTETVKLTATINGVSATTTTQQTISSRWPEAFITRGTTSTASAIYTVEFPTATSPTTTALLITDEDGSSISGTTFLGDFTAIDFDALTSGNFLQATPDAVDTVSTVASTSYHSFLWLFERTSSTAGEDDSRKVALFKLVSATKAEASTNFTLTYERIF